MQSDSKSADAEIESSGKQYHAEVVSAVQSDSKSGDTEIKPSEQQQSEVISAMQLDSKGGDAEAKSSEQYYEVVSAMQSDPKSGNIEIKSSTEKQHPELVLDMQSESKSADPEIESPGEQQHSEMVSAMQLDSKSGDTEIKSSAEEQQPDVVSLMQLDDSKSGDSEIESPVEHQQGVLAMHSDSKNGGTEIKSFAEEQHPEVVSAMPVVTEFFVAINKKDVDALSDIISDKCIFHDLCFPKAFEGKQAVLQYAKDLMEAMGKGMLFVIDGTSEGDDLTVSVLWHLEWEGHIFPFTKGCCLFNCERKGDRLFIRHVHDFLESPIKLGELILRLLKTITSFFEQFPSVIKRII